MSSSLLENAKKPYNQGFPLLIHTKFSMLLQAKIHIQHGAFEEKDPLAVLSSIHSQTPDRV